MQVGVDVKCMHTNFGGHGLSGFGDIASFQNWPFIVNSFFLPPPLSSPPPPLTEYITGSLVSLNDITISLQLHTDQQMTNTIEPYTDSTSIPGMNCDSANEIQYMLVS